MRFTWRCLLAIVIWGGAASAVAQDVPDLVKPDVSRERTADEATLAERATPPDLSRPPVGEDVEAVGQQDQTGTLMGYGRVWQGLQHLERIQFLSNIASLRNSEPLFPLRAPTQPLDLSVPRPVPLTRTDVDPLLGAPLSPLMSPGRNLELYLSDNYGMNFGVYYTLLYQTISNAVPDASHNLGTGRLDFNLVWNLWEDPEFGFADAMQNAHGLVGFLMRQGNQIGVPNDVSSRQSAGSIVGLDSLYTGDEGSAATLNLLYYQQGLLDDRLVISLGKLHPNQYIALNFWANDEARQFLAGPFDGILPLGTSHGGYQWGAAVQVIPDDRFFINAIVTDALGRPDSNWGTLDEGYVWTAAEVGTILPFDEEALGGPTVLSAIWSGTNLNHFSPTPEFRWANAFGLQWQGHLTEHLGYFAQGAVAQETMSPLAAQFSVGMSLEAPFGRRGDLVGGAFNWSQPSDADPTAVSEQSLMEFFYRVQITASCQLTPDLQIILDPGLRPDGDPVFVFGLRLTTDF